MTTLTTTRVWAAATRPATLWAAVAPVAVGTACAAVAGGARPLVALLCLAGALLLQITANLVNDASDFERGADTGARLGPRRAVQAGWLTAGEVRRGAAIALALAAACGVGLAVIAGWVIIPLWIAAITAAVLYTAGPRPLGYLGLGDVLVFLFFGFAGVVGTTFAQTGSAPMVAWIAALPVGALATAVLAVNNLRDRATDATAGKRTLAVRLGERAVRAEYRALVAVAAVTPVALAVVQRSAWLLLPLLASPLAADPLRRMRRSDGAALNPALGATARLLLVFGVLFALGLALGVPAV
jgi:1,4-dihydroxy-2-naphthoate octaprenyltransferase